MPEIDAIELRARMERGDKMVILDTRTPEEYRRFCIPGGRSCPAASWPSASRTLPLTWTLIPPWSSTAPARTRSIIGTRALQRMGLEREVVGLKNGTSGWVLAGYSLESGADRDELPAVSARRPRPTCRILRRPLRCRGWRPFPDVAGVDALLARSDNESVYFIDVPHRRGVCRRPYRRFPLVPRRPVRTAQRRRGVVKNAPIVFCCDGKARAALAASWYRSAGLWRGIRAGRRRRGLGCGRPALESGTSVGARAWTGR